MYARHQKSIKLLKIVKYKPTIKLHENSTVLTKQHGLECESYLNTGTL